MSFSFLQCADACFLLTCRFLSHPRCRWGGHWQLAPRGNSGIWHGFEHSAAAASGGHPPASWPARTSFINPRKPACIQNHCCCDAQTTSRLTHVQDGIRSRLLYLFAQMRRLGALRRLVHRRRAGQRRKASSCSLQPNCSPGPSCSLHPSCSPVPSRPASAAATAAVASATDAGTAPPWHTTVPPASAARPAAAVDGDTAQQQLQQSAETAATASERPRAADATQETAVAATLQVKQARLLCVITQRLACLTAAAVCKAVEIHEAEVVVRI